MLIIHCLLPPASSQWGKWLQCGVKNRKAELTRNYRLAVGSSQFFLINHGILPIIKINNRCPLRTPHERCHLSPFWEETDNMTGNIAEIMKKNGSGQGEALSEEPCNQSPKGSPPARHSPWENSTFQAGLLLLARFTSSVSTRQVLCGGISGSPAIPPVSPWVTVNVGQSPWNATWRVSSF